MPAPEKSNIKLGLFVLAGAFLLILTLYMIGKNENMFGSNFALKARFKNVNGLISGNNIRFSGIQVGTVKGIALIDDTTIEVTMLVATKMKPFIRKNALASIGTEGLMGNKIVNIQPGEGRAPEVAEGDLLANQKATNMDEMLGTLNKTNENIEDFSEGLKIAVRRVNNSTALWSVLNETSLAPNLKASLANISQATAHADAMMNDLRTLIAGVKGGQGSVGALLTDTSFAHSLQEATARIKTVGDKAGGLADELTKMTGDIRRDIDSGTGTVHALLKDSSMVRKLNASLDNVQKGTAAFSEDMEALKHNFLLRGYFRRLEKQQKNAGQSP
ncbi:MAG: MlaD family protein [Puia sp.]|nr:MlaD family protein [Puia sp.]